MSLATIKSGKLITDQTSYELFERNPLNVHIQYKGESIVPHAGTVRTTYTVPSGKFAIVKNTIVHTRVEEAATTAARKGTYIRLVIGGIAYHFNLAVLGVDQNTIGNNSTLTSSNDVLLRTGDVVQIETNNYSTGGTVSHIGTALITEYEL